MNSQPTDQPQAQNARDLPPFSRVEIHILSTRAGYTVTAKSTDARGLPLPIKHQPAQGPVKHKSASAANDDANARAASFTDEGREVYATIESRKASEGRRRLF